MDLRYSDTEEAFRADLRRWLEDVVPRLPPEPSPFDWPERRRYDTSWQRMLYEAGYAGIDWPVEGGGRGASPVEALVYLEELERAHAPYVGVNFVGLLHAGPTIVAEGTPEQKAKFLPPILRGDEVWCQGFSEPDAGSDLAALRTKAVRRGDDYVVSGSKVWTSHAEVADYCELLVRTSDEGPKHRGITWLVMPMDSDGIEIRPLRTISGTSEFAELFLDEVRVPLSNRVGEENDGWRVTMVTLSFERGTAFVGELLQTMELLRRLRQLARHSGVWSDRAIRRRVGHLGAELDAMWALARRNVSQAARTGVPGVGGSVFKLAFSELRQKVAQLGMDLLGPAGTSVHDLDANGGQPAPGNGALVELWLNAFNRTIAAGTSQIQRNIVAERILGLPKS
ncbi:MAG TPA: acyl-CoA dehydrogenase family protein [Acidimicrobiales bacterium]|nr:acyl-CoA dehydrogenase family protein [Acidimicrobiales bacterium]